MFRVCTERYDPLSSTGVASIYKVPRANIYLSAHQGFSIVFISANFERAVGFVFRLFVKEDIDA